MSKRDFFSDPGDNDEGPASKARKLDDSEDGGGGGRAGRVRKKSAKVLEMEEFEQAEKVSTKKSKTPKPVSANVSGADLDEILVVKKPKTPTSAIRNQPEPTPSRKSKKSSETPVLIAGRPVPAELSLRLPPAPMLTPEALDAQLNIQQDIKPEVRPPASILPSADVPTPSVVKQENPKSVIKHLLSSPAAGSPHQISSGLLSLNATAPPKKSSKKIKFEDANSATPRTKEKKEKKMKIEIMSPSELGPPISSVTPPEPKAPSLKMKIVSGSNPMAAQVALETDKSVVTSTPKVKKVSKKAKTPKSEPVEDVKLEIAAETEVGQKVPKEKKKKSSKKKEKLIQDAITAAQQMPNLAALVASPQTQAAMGLGDSPTPPPKPSKKKVKKETPSPAVSKKEANTSDSLVMDFDDGGMEDEAEESTLVIAETEKKKKKVSAKKKEKKDKDGMTSPKSPKPEKEKKAPKRAPTAYMLFCNTHRPAIVQENPGIEFAGISRKLGELWQTQSNKQKLQWRRKAQRRLKKSNLISTGKVGKESLGGSSASVATPAASQAGGTLSSTNQKLALMLQKNKPVAMDEGPLSPAKNFSIEPLDVAAHLKLLGESLSIIGMRLQEHKGMIAVQGSLSVLLDSLLCACGPLLCLTQQVPGMDGCSPLVHAQTLDSVAYVMPGL